MALITFILPTYRRPTLLRRAVESVLAQSFDDFEVRVYDDASGDETGEVMADLAARDRRVSYRPRERNLGTIVNCGRALEEVDTPFFVLAADDDWLLPGCFEAAMRSARANPEAMFVVTQVVHVDARGRVIDGYGRFWHQSRRFDPPDGLLAMLHHNPQTTTGTVYRREVLDLVGGFDPEVGNAADWDFGFRIAACHSFAVDPTPGGVHVIEDDTLSAGGQLGAIWPHWAVIARKLEALTCMEPAVRRRVARLINARIPALLFRVGIGAARRGRWQDAAGAARLLHREYGRFALGLVVRAVVIGCRALPPLRRLVTGISERSRPYARRGGRPLTLAEYLTRLEA